MADAMKLVPVEPTEAMIEAFYHAEGPVGPDRVVSWSVATAMARGNVMRHLDDIFANAYRAMLAASPPAREEAPGEGAGEYGYEMPGVIVRLQDCLDAATAASVPVDTGDLRAALSTLRARTSEPAREDEPKRGEVRTINGQRCQFIERELEGDKWMVLGPVHPAPATADKLKVAVDLLEEVKSRTYVGKGDKPVMRSRYGHYDASVYHKVCAFLATLNEEVC